MGTIYKKVFRDFLFNFDPERVHDAALRGARAAQSLPPLNAALALLARPRPLPVKVAGLEFRNPVGLSAGFDRNCEAARFLSALGFGFLELGTVTLRPQSGNPRPRLFRLEAERGLINRMGFHNCGAWQAARSLERLLPLQARVGISIGANTDCNPADAPRNCLEALRALYPLADYVTVNVSSPYELYRRRMHRPDSIRALMAPLLDYAAGQRLRKPLFLKMAPDLEDEGVADLVQAAADLGFGLVTTNTTTRRETVPQAWHAYEGGLSGLPLLSPSNAVLARVAGLAEGRFPVIGSGGVLDGRAAREKLDLGADLVQIYSGLVYEGPFLVREITDHLFRGGWTPPRN
jgi:dihydroorotate dehydrogenase